MWKTKFYWLVWLWETTNHVQREFCVSFPCGNLVHHQVVEIIFAVWSFEREKFFQIFVTAKIKHPLLHPCTIKSLNFPLLKPHCNFWKTYTLGGTPFFDPSVYSCPPLVNVGNDEGDLVGFEVVGLWVGKFSFKTTKEIQKVAFFDQILSFTNL